jgi:hypothetical protein
MPNAATGTTRETVSGPEPCQFNPKNKGFGFDSDQNPINELEKTPLGVLQQLLPDLRSD